MDLKRFALIGAHIEREKLMDLVRQIDEFIKKCEAGTVNEQGEFVRTPGPSLTKVREAAKKSGMSLAARKAVSLRMTKYWAERRKAKAKKK